MPRLNYLGLLLYVSFLALLCIFSLELFRIEPLFCLSSFALSHLICRLSGYLPSGRPRYSYTHLDRPPVLAMTSPSHARPPTRVGYDEHYVRTPKQTFNGADIPFVSLNAEGRKRRQDRAEEKTYVDQLANSGSHNIENRYEVKSKRRPEKKVGLGQAVDVPPQDLPSFFARSARGVEGLGNSTSDWSTT